MSSSHRLRGRAEVVLHDVGCGDWQYMSKLQMPAHAKYHGYDVLDSIIEKNNKIYSNELIAFSKIDGVNFIDKSLVWHVFTWMAA